MRRLSYADPGMLASIIVFVVALTLSTYYVSSEWLRIVDAYSNTYVSDEIYYVDTARRYLQRIFDVRLDYWSYSGETEEDYFNLEHPPLGKYIIALSIVACGDRPPCWRLPGVIEAILILMLAPLAILLLGYRIHGGLRPLHFIAASASTLAIASDPVFIHAASVAMLDIHLAFFTFLTLILVLHRRVLLACLAAGLALSVKMSGLAALVGLMLSLSVIYSDRALRLLWAIAAVVVAGSIYALAHAPLLLHFSPGTLVSETIDAIRWHTSPRPEGPPTSTPLGWVLNSNPFYYSYGPIPLPAKLNTFIHLPVFILSLYIVVVEMLSSRGYWIGVSHLFYFSVILMYYSVYAAGNTTLYSFYSVQLSPIAGVFIGELLLLVGGASFAPSDRPSSDG